MGNAYVRLKPASDWCKKMIKAHGEFWMAQPPTHDNQKYFTITAVKDRYVIWISANRIEALN